MLDGHVYVQWHIYRGKGEKPKTSMGVAPTHPENAGILFLEMLHLVLFNVLLNQIYINNS